MIMEMFGAFCMATIMIGLIMFTGFLFGVRFAAWVIANDKEAYEGAIKRFKS